MVDQPEEQIKNESITQLFPVSSGYKHRDLLQITDQPFDTSDEAKKNFVIEK